MLKVKGRTFIDELGIGDTIFIKGASINDIKFEINPSIKAENKVLTHPKLELKKKSESFTIDILLFYIAGLIRSSILDFLHYNYPNLKEFKFFLEETFANSLPVARKRGILLQIGINPTASSSFYYVLKKKENRYFKWSSFCEKTVSVTYPIYPSNAEDFEFDESKARSSILANLINFLDAEILKYTALELKQKNIFDIGACHDCIYTIHNS